ERSLPLADALGGDGLVAYWLNGAPLPRQHGFPLRLVVPGWYGMASVKWLARIEISERPFEGVDAGEHVLEGRAWSGFGPVASVEVSVEGGASWRPAELEPPAGRWAWVGWRVGWLAQPGEPGLSCRARDEAGNEQPLEPTWNVGGYVNNAVQRIPVTVR